MPKKLEEKLVKVLITVKPEVAADLKERARIRSKPGAKVSQGDIIEELLAGYVIEPEQRSSFNQPKKAPKETVYIQVPKLNWRDGRQPLLKPKDKK